MTPPCGVPATVRRTVPCCMTPARSSARRSLSTWRSQTRSSIACSNRSCGIASTVGEVRLDHPPPALPRLIDEDLEGVVRRPSRAKPERARPEVRLEDRLEHDLRGG